MTKVVVELRVGVKFAWRWRWLYLPGVVFLAACGMAPDWDKVERMAGRALRVRLVPVKADEVQA